MFSREILANALVRCFMLGGDSNYNARSIPNSETVTANPKSESHPEIANHKPA